MKINYLAPHESGRHTGRGAPRSPFKAVCLTAGLAALATTLQAHANCADSIVRHLTPTEVPQSGPFVPAVYRPDAFAASLLRVGDLGADAPIVGVWEFQFGGFLKDFGTQAFHAGGTETMFSAGIDPATGDVCQGVWRRVGPATYTLHHIAMGWTAPGAQYGLLIDIHGRITLDSSRNSFVGTYTVSLYNATPENPFDESAGPFVSGSGTMTAKRVKQD